MSNRGTVGSSPFCLCADLKKTSANHLLPTRPYYHNPDFASRPSHPSRPVAQSPSIFHVLPAVFQALFHTAIFNPHKSDVRRPIRVQNFADDGMPECGVRLTAGCAYLRGSFWLGSMAKAEVDTRNGRSFSLDSQDPSITAVRYWPPC